MVVYNSMKHTQTTHEEDGSTGQKPTPEEIHQAAGVIKRLPKGFLPFELFIAIAEKVTTPTMETAPLRTNPEGGVEVLLTQRPADDPHWPSGWHIPGTVIRATDNEGNFQSGFERVLKDELHGTVRPLGSLHRVGIKFWDVNRGRELDIVHYFETDAADEAVMEGKFFDVNDLPETTLEHHKVMIPEIAAAFLRDKSHPSG